MKKYSLALFIVLAFNFSGLVSAQIKKEIESPEFPQLSLRTSLTSYLDEDAGVMLGINYRWAEKFSASFESTWIFYNPLFRDDFTSKPLRPKGYKLRADLKYHFPQRIFRDMEVFIAPEFHFKYTRTLRNAVFGINCQGGNCAYFQNADYIEIKHETGGLLKIGVLAPVRFIDNNRWFIELYGGLGYKHMKYRETDLPIGGSFTNLPGRSFLDLGMITNRNEFGYPMLPGGLKVIFILR
jgi:hypothetical protein